jgi:hypothetical protein
MFQEVSDRPIVAAQVPDTHRIVVVNDVGKRITVEEDHAYNDKRVPHRRREQFSRRGVPETQRPIVAGSENALAIRAERGMTDRAPVPERRSL